ncbi:uncharacterized protein fndc7b [Gasterosteus aculeatus]
MGLLGAIGLSLALVSLTQIPYSDGCKILSAKSSSASSILVKWEKYAGATNYFLDFRVTNNTQIAPNVLTLPATWTEHDMQALRPGTTYKVTLKVFQFYTLICTITAEATTVPATSQIVDGTALTSTSVLVKWTAIPSAALYYLLMYSQTGQILTNETSTNSSAVVLNLQPSTIYHFYIVAANQAGPAARSKVWAVTTLARPPLNITATYTGSDSARVTWQPVEDVLLYKVSIQDIDKPTRPPSVYNVTDTKVDVKGIFPCTTNLISISSYSKFLVPSEPTDYTYTANTLEAVSSVSVSYTCTNNSARVDWSAVFGAFSYKATAIGKNGTELSCSSQSTSCQIIGLSCGQNYVVHVNPMSENCRQSMSTTSDAFQTVSCPPENLELLRDCSSDVILFSWDHTNSSDNYLATSVDSQGVIQKCLTEGNSCYFTNMMCGEHYNFSVQTIAGRCSSQNSATVDIRTAPCIPQNLETSMSCNSNVLLTKWDLSRGALGYEVKVFGNIENKNFYNCSSIFNSCAMADMECGQFFSTHITAHNDECASPEMMGPVAQTNPCVPQNVSAIMNCGSNSITITWLLSGGAIFYIAIAKDSDGVIHSCNSMDLKCTIQGLKCSTNYTAYVIASNLMCNSSDSEMVAVETGACPPDQVTASLDCVANEALISWRGQSKKNSYTATIIDKDQGLLSCSSTNTSCRVPNLKCGQLYTVSVRQHDGTCPSMPSEAIYMESVPCGPNVKSNLDCSSQVLTLSWNATKNAEGYTTVVSDGRNKTSHVTTMPAVTLTALECGLFYTLTVTSFNSTCVSQPSVMSIKETPCVPTNVTVERNCDQTFGKVSWNASRGALRYQAAAVDTDGKRLLCSSNETWCTLNGLVCSQVYSVGVSAQDDTCSSNYSSAKTLRAAPCAPTQLDVSVGCANSSATLSWSSSPNAVSYTGKAVAADGHIVTCDAGVRLGCQMDGLHCGRKYNFTVSASDGGCQSPDGAPVTVTTAPCAVKSVLNTLNCSTNILTISWAPASMPLNYSATATAGGGNVLHCLTEGSSCTLANLQCGKSYNVTVRAISDTCEGQSGVPEIVNSTPCVPVNVRGVVDCPNNTLKASWDAAAGAASYISTLSRAGGSSSSCTEAGTSCLFTDLQCAQTYTLSVVATNDRCNSSEGPRMSATAAPCDPTNVASALHCLSGVVTVSWGASAGSKYYTALARATGHADYCNSNGTSCELTGLQCGKDYTVTVLAGDGNCNSSVLAKTNVTTAPCAPVIQHHSLDCVTNHAVVTWVEDKDAMSVAVNATSSLGHSASCSSSTNGSCVLDELRCGHSYTVQAVARGVQCASKPSSPLQIVTAPCTPANVEDTYSSETGIVLLSWDDTLGGESFYANVYSGDHAASCSTDQTDCSLSSLLCGRVYDVTVVAVADHCNSSVPGVTQIQTAPCSPKNVSASLLCDNNTAAVSWQPSSGAVSYQVTAQGRDGDVKQCATNDTMCLLPNMQCAQTYKITVTPFSESYKGYDSSPHIYIAGPCPPTDVHVSLQCVGNVGHVTWAAAPLADLYVATVLPSAGDQQKHNCTSNGTSCSLTNLSCGQTAAVTVVTSERGCTSEPSPPFTFQTVICPPTSVTGVTSCGNNDIAVSWNPSTGSGVNYVVHAHKEGGTSANFSTTQTSHALTGLQCGMLYSLTVAARDSECTSVLGVPILTETAPCPPINLTAKAECGTSMGTLTWAESVNAISYTATATGTHGHVVSCSSNTTTCSVKLDCGRRYSAVVVASSATCNSSAGASLTFDSAHCLPDSVVADLDCNLNSFAVRWRASIVGANSYSAIAIGSDGSRATCNSSYTNCTIQNLNCGLNYGIVVNTLSVDCGTIEASDYMMQSAPCKPEGVLVDLQCSTNIASVTWGNSGPDQTQAVSAVDSRGMTTTCNSSSSNCTFDQLTCGESYVISVVGQTDHKCSSEPAVAETLLAAPCVPTHLTAQVQCETGITMVTWDSARGAKSYTVYARGNLGHSAECNSTDTSCNSLDLACGQDYTITVVARHDSCISSVSESINVTQVPCPHSGVQASVDCDSNTALVSWTPGRGIREYYASADAFSISHKLDCSTNGSSCNISALRCGQRYRVSVSGRGENCPSPTESWQPITTAPCPPTQLRVDSSCESSNISVSWKASQGSASYMAVAKDAQGRHWSCNTSSTTCQMSGLLCGQQYQVYVAGMDETCIGAKSDVKVINTAPCVPQKVQNDLNCLSGVLNVTWQSSGNVSAFRVSVESGEGHVSICETNELHCVVHNTQCGLTYNVSVVAQDEACNSSRSPQQQVLTAPCPPQTFSPTINCASGVASVTWNSSMAGVVYAVSAVEAAGRQHNCSGTNTGCDLGMLECGTEYNVTVTPSRNGCVGRDSATKLIKTAPCVPRLTDVEIDCLVNSAWVIYEGSAGAEEYIVMATDGQGDIQTFECNSTSDGTCPLPPLMCSQNLTFTMTARNWQCPSAPSNAVTMETAPCPPENVKKSVVCDNRTVDISWSAVPGAVTYAATLEAINGGQQFCCTTSDTACDISELPCGEMYILVVVAEGRTCNSSQSEGELTMTVPCVPQKLNASLSCSNNVASMYWEQSRGGQYYTVRAVGTDGHEHECSSNANQCDVTGLHCGQYYTASVTAANTACQSKGSDSVTVKTGPCTPANVSSVVDCEGNTLITSWSESPGADSYIATVQDSNGQSTTCQGTTSGSCNVTGLGCGQVYHVSVVSSDGYCNSPSTPVVVAPSVPCEARLIKAAVDCYGQVAVVTWYPSGGATSYIVTAATASGVNVTCEANDTAHCDLEGLLCGHSYSVSVTATGQTCSSVAHMTEPLVTEPCIPGYIVTGYSMTIGQVWWDMTAAADFYTVDGVTEEGLRVSCNTTDTYCTLSNMECGQMYTINVTANNPVCQGVSTSTEAAAIMTEPCPPDNLQTAVQCHNDMAIVTWEASVGAVGYEALLAGRDGHGLSCYTNNTFCNIEGLHCGITYYANIIAVGETLNSSTSNTILLLSAPCAAKDVAADLDCYNKTARVSWSPSAGGKSYAVTAVGEDGHRAACETDGQQCKLSDLRCGLTYNVSLTTISDHCQTETLAAVAFSTWPCKPLRTGVDLQCGTRAAVMYWEQVEGVELYMAAATSGKGMTLQCNSTNSACQFSNLYCGKSYNFSVTAFSGMCFSEISSTVEIQTGPCQPTGLTVSGSCDNKTVVLDWSAAEGASAYVVSATGDQGYVTSFQTEDTTAEAELPCGQLFTFTVKAQGDQCGSAAGTAASFKTGPCAPRHVQSFVQCENSLGSVSWGSSEGAESYLAIAVGQDNHTHVCTTNTTICSWDDLHCGERYTVHVIANDNLCSSMPSNSTSIQMAPCVPQNLKSSLNCTMKVGSLTWNASDTAELYIVTAETTGHKVLLSTNETWTFLSELHCGEKYFLSVQAHDSVCKSLPSPPLMLESEPCPPTGVTSLMNCVSNIAVVSWNTSAGAEFYTATLTQKDGQTQNCWSESNQCGMSGVPCGQNYSVTVVASNRKCSSDPIEGDTLQSEPCVPTGVDVTIDCSENQVLVSWSASKGASSYKVTAQSTQGATSSCESAHPTCTLTNLTCGQVFSVQVVAQNEICSSLPSAATQFNSVPCTPRIGSVVLDCFTDSALLDWANAEGALNYTATARSSASGHISTCTSDFTNCELKELECGQTYDVVAVASNEECSSPPSTQLQVESVPCPPKNVSPVVDCSTNTARVEWQASRGADSYTVQAFGVEEDESHCETDLQSCVLGDLMCGFTYNISVFAVNGVCNNSRSDMTQLQAVPCVPQQVNARVVCASGDVAVSWEPSKGASSYTTVARGNAGYASTCNGSETTSLLKDLLCGHNYSITVSASDETCSSAGSFAVELNTAPCIPQGATAEMVCSNDTGVVSWEMEDGVSSYMVRAFGPDADKIQCNSTGTSCQLPNMHCGQLYNLTLTAKDGECDNSQAFLNLQSAPCRPTNVKASLRCRSNSAAAVTWERASGALSYLAVGVAADGSHRTECNNTATYCDLSELQCGKTYNVSVFAQDESCSSVQGDAAYVRTAPCAPQDVAIDAQCDNGALAVSWSPNPDVQYFHVAAVSSTGGRLHCNSSGTACTMRDLPCGQHYNVTALSVARSGCESTPSAVVETSTAPCVPSNAHGRLDCISNSAWVTWDASEGALSYYVMAQEVGGHNISCTTSSSPCDIPDLKCGTHYSFYVTAVNKQCRSNHSSFELQTGPCALASITAETQCDSSTIVVEWETEGDTTLYMVTAEADDRTTLSCNSSSSSCVLQDISCGMHYSIIVSTSSDKCSSLRSPPKKIKTAPCVPADVVVAALCEGNGAVVTWGHSPVATSYLLTATGRDGHVANCSTPENNCTLTALHCGQTYNLSVTAVGDNCTSQPGTSSYRAVPCKPSALTVDIDCETNSAMLSWGASEGAVEYFGCAQSMHRDALYCNSTVPSCTIEGMGCGDIYNFSVEASNGVCNGSFSPPVQAGAVPCPPTVFDVRMQRIGNAHWAMISWDSVNCSDVEYLMEMTGRINNNPQTLMQVSSYWFSRTYFELPVPCSTPYNFTLRSRNSAGASKPSGAVAGVSVPCAPQKVKYTGDAVSAVLSWESSLFATRYTVYSVSGADPVKICNTTGLSCQLTNFDPNTTEVTASNAAGESVPNRDITGPLVSRRKRDLQGSVINDHLDTSLEVPKVLTVTASGASLYVKWLTVKNTTEYTVVMEEKPQTNQPPRVRTVRGHSHNEAGLKPRTKYCVKVAARNGIEQSDYSRPACRTTGALLRNTTGTLK